MRREQSRRAAKRLFIIWVSLLIVLFVCIATTFAQRNAPRHYRHRATMAPGAVGRDMLTRGGPLQGYFQPVKITGPQGAKISLVVGGKFEKPKDMPAMAGMLIGGVYRFKVSNIPGSEGEEVYPTVEVINRLYPPYGQKTRFPIPIELTQQELELAASGLFVIRVIYLEDPTNAFPFRENPKQQRFFDVGPDQEPLQVADTLGRPMAILRIGSRVPDEVLTGNFLYGSPPLKIIEKPALKPKPVELKSVKPAAQQTGGKHGNRN